MNGHPGFSSQSPKAPGPDMGMRVPSFRTINAAHLASWRWARAAFEQGALPSLLMMPGIAPVFSLPGDRMFQATGIMDGRQRPAIMHAYGGAKAGMERSLATIAAEGLLPCLALQENRRCGPVWVSALLQEQPLTSSCYLPVFLKGKNYLYSRAGNSGTPLGSRALPCPNGLLELMLTLDRMGATPLPT